MNFVLQVGSHSYVVDADKLEQITDVLADCLLFSHEYNRGENGGDSYYTYHAYEQSVEETMKEVKALPNGALALAKLAGRKK
jgi:hypothetical protein